MQPANHCNEIRIAHAKLSQVLEPRVHLRSMLSCPGGSASVPVRKKERERERGDWSVDCRRSVHLDGAIDPTNKCVCRQEANRAREETIYHTSEKAVAEE